MLSCTAASDRLLPSLVHVVLAHTSGSDPVLKAMLADAAGSTICILYPLSASGQHIPYNVLRIFCNLARPGLPGQVRLGCSSGSSGIQPQ